ncbi:glycosyltransferase family 4 protein [Candidatus Methylomirabilis sp.]|uniref:Glycosyltransferase family 4 protein n=1 Tax=Candidatus Methylomirabilis tolerans TaxID=3123416 RepID=A0AAJ1AGX6_9BACT|nr:glycosyltransferase family 4 protein [Candidatus Methylomirabilis sp.]
MQEQRRNRKPSVVTEGAIRVVRVVARLSIGGPTIHVMGLNAGLDPTRFAQSLATGLENPGEGSMLAEALARGVKPIVVPEIVAEASLKPRDITALLKLYRLIRQERPHIVHTHTAKAGFLGRLAARLAGVPVIIHTYHGHILHGYYGPLTTGLLRTMERMLARITHCIIAVSEQVKGDLIAYGVAPSGKIRVIPLGLELDPFLGCAVYKGEFRRELDLDDNARLVGIVGRIVPIKNHRLFLQAAALVIASEPAARFVIVGDGALRLEMEQQARALGIADRVLFTGWRRDLPRIYADLDVLTVSSNNEGTPVSVIEAMAAGCPVVATRVGGLPDLITDGETGFLVPPSDAQALAAAILRVLRDPETAGRMGRTARASVQQRFTMKRLISDMEQLYIQILTDKGVKAPLDKDCPL